MRPGNCSGSYSTLSNGRWNVKWFRFNFRGCPASGSPVNLSAPSEKYREYITTIGEITTQGAAALSAGDMEQVGVLMNQNQIFLERLEVSSTPLRRLIRAAFPTSFGVKLSGAGGGGCMIALTDQPEQTAEAILSAGGSPYITSMSQTGVKLESYHSLLSGKKTQ